MTVDTHDVWLDKNSGNLNDFVEMVSQSADPARMPMADRIVKNVPIYSGDMIRGIGKARKELMAEWVHVFRSGPGIIVIEGAFPDLTVVDRATKVFEDLIASEKAEGLVGADHFAKPGANDRVWNSLEKHCLADPEGYAHYFGNVAVAMVAEAWLGPMYQVTAQLNRVNPGGKAQSAHRDYHLGFMTPEKAASFPGHVHDLSPLLTLQGALAQCDMPLESGPTQYLPFSQLYFEGYLAFTRPEFQEYFASNHIQLPLKKGDAVFFNPALMHAAGTNSSADIYRMANLLQISSGFGRALEAVDRTRISKALYPALLDIKSGGKLGDAQCDAAIAATAEGYPFPTNLDRDPPVGGLVPKSPREHMLQALESGMPVQDFSDLLDTLSEKRLT